MSPWAPDAQHLITASIAFEPAAPRQQSRRPLLFAVAALCAVAVGIGGFIALRSGPKGDAATVRYITDTEHRDEAFSYATATATIDASPAMRMTVSVRAPGMSADLATEVDRASQRAAMSITSTADDASFDVGTIDMKLIGDTSTGITYLSSDLLHTWFQVDTEWISTEQGTGNDGLGIDSWFAEPIDITAIFAGVDPVDLGVEMVDGEAMKHFSVTMTADDLLAVDPTALENLGTSGLQDMGVDTIVFNVWVDEASRLRRVAMAVDAFGGQTEFDMRIEHLDAPIDIALPDPADVTDWATAAGAELWRDTTVIDDTDWDDTASDDTGWDNTGWDDTASDEPDVGVPADTENEPTEPNAPAHENAAELADVDLEAAEVGESIATGGERERRHTPAASVDASD